MKKNILLFIITILFSGCHTFFPVDKNELTELEGNNSVKIVFNDGKTEQINNVTKMRLTNKNEFELISAINTTSKNDTIYYYFPKENIKEIRVKKIDIPKTIITPLFMAMGAVLALAFLFNIIYPGGFSI